MDNKRIINYICTQQNNNIYTMKDLKDLTPSQLLAFNNVAENLQTEFKAATMAFYLAFDFNPFEVSEFKALKDLNEVFLENTYKEYIRQTTENKFKDTDTDTDTQTETNN